MKRLCSVYRGSLVELMYLYVDQAEGLERVPPELLARFGKLAEVMTLELHPARKLARADINVVLQSIEEKGFYFQTPPLEREPEAQMFPRLQEHMDKSE